MNGTADHPIFSTDPAEHMQYIHKEVCVSTEDGKTHTGCVYTVDPVSHSLVLVQFRQGDNNSVSIIMGHSVQSVVVLDENTETHREEMKQLFKPEVTQYVSPEESKRRQEQVKLWLVKNRLPVEVTGTDDELLSISGALWVEPPYEAENCRSTNEIILGRVQGLIQNMPKDLKDW